MNAFSLFKVLTLVCFLVVGRYAYSDSIPLGDVSEETDCSKFTNNKECEIRQGSLKKQELKDSKALCTTAKKDYDTLNIKSNMACNAFEKTSTSKDKTVGAKCAKNVVNCRAKIAGLYDKTATGANADPSVTDILTGFVNQKLGISNQTSLSAPVTTQCVKDPDSKDRKQTAKDQKEKIEKLEEKIKKELDEQAKLLEKQREKIDEIKKKTNEVEAEAKKELLKKDAKEREQTAAANKDTIDVAKRLRATATQITMKQQALAKERFSYQKAMLNLSSDKITEQCKAEFESLKASVVNARIGDPRNTTEDQKKLEAFAARFKGKISGTASLAAVLTLTKKACFEKANTQINEINLSSSQNIQTINGQIEELQSQMADEKKSAENAKASIEAIKKGMTEEKAAEAKEKLDKLTNLNDEVISFQTSTAEKMKISKAQAEKLQDDIKKLKLNTDFDVQTAFDDAESAIQTAESARQVAYEACGCSSDEKKNECPRLKASEIDLSKVKADIKKESTKN